jgi:hypothetical protein
MNRALWTGDLSKFNCPPWPCPVCAAGVARLQPDTLVFEETVPSKYAHGGDEFDPYSFDYGFTAWARCSSCEQRFALGGRGSVKQHEPDGDLGEYFWPLFCFPMPHIIAVPKGCPGAIALELEAAFSGFWSSPAACAGRMRVALELLLDHLRIQKKKRNNRGKFYGLSLHERVKLYSVRRPDIGQQLMALKWLGNSGSHGGDLNRTDVLDAFEVLEHALGEIVEGHADRVVALAKRLTKKHGKR